MFADTTSWLYPQVQSRLNIEDLVNKISHVVASISCSTWRLELKVFGQRMWALVSHQREVWESGASAACQFGDAESARQHYCYLTSEPKGRIMTVLLVLAQQGYRSDIGRNASASHDADAHIVVIEPQCRITRRKPCTFDCWSEELLIRRISNIWYLIISVASKSAGNALPCQCHLEFRWL